MKTALILLIGLGTLGQAQDNKPDEKRRLESVTWDLKAHKLVWVVQKGVEVDGHFVASASSRYEISPDHAAMTVADETRGFGEDEAVNLHQLLDVLSMYCAESVVWWDRGQGIPLDQNGHPLTPARPAPGPRPDTPTQKPVKVKDAVEKEAPPSAIRESTAVARFSVPR